VIVWTVFAADSDALDELLRAAREQPDARGSIASNFRSSDPVAPRRVPHGKRSPVWDRSGRMPGDGPRWSCSVLAEPTELGSV